MTPKKRTTTWRLLAAVAAVALLTGCSATTLEQVDERLVTARGQVLALEYGGNAGADPLTLGGEADARRVKLAAELGKLADEAYKAARAEAARNAATDQQDAVALYRSAAVALWQMKRVVGSGPKIAEPEGIPTLSTIRNESVEICNVINRNDSTAEPGHCLATEIAAALGPAEANRSTLEELYAKFKVLQNTPDIPLLSADDQEAATRILGSFEEAAAGMAAVRSKALLAPLAAGYREGVDRNWGIAFCNLDSARFVLSGVQNGSTLRANTDRVYNPMRTAFNQRYSRFRNTCPAFYEWIRQGEALRLSGR